VIWVVVIAATVIAIGALVWLQFRRKPAARPEALSPDHVAAPVVDFTIAGPEAQVYFEVAVTESESNSAINAALVNRAVEVVREKSEGIPMPQVRSIAAFARDGDGWSEVGAVVLAAPGELPPLPGDRRAARRPGRGFDPLEHLDDYPGWPPRLEVARREDGLPPLRDELRLPAQVTGRLRAQGIDPDTAGAGALVLGVMQMAGYTSVPIDEDTFRVRRLGRTALIRLVEHHAGEHPELEEAELRRFVVDVMAAGVDVGLLVTEKYALFEVYEWERRDRRLRFITRERLQRFLDALAIA